MGGLVLASDISNTEGHDDFVINLNVHHPIKLLFQRSISCNLKQSKNDSKCILEWRSP